MTNISAAIAHTTAQPSYSQVVDTYLSVRQSCPPNQSSTAAVTANSMRGLFLVVAALVMMSVLVSLVQAYFRKPSHASQKQLLRKEAGNNHERNEAEGDTEER
eukprot:1190206-Prorocentrum_minimum.AAC.1